MLKGITVNVCKISARNFLSKLKSLALVNVQFVEPTAFVDLREHLFEISTKFSTAVLKTPACVWHKKFC